MVARAVGERMDDVCKAIEAILAVSPQGTKGDKGVIECPVCKGKLVYKRSCDRRASLRAACETPDCVRLIE